MVRNSYTRRTGWFMLVVACLFVCLPACIAHAQPGWYKKPPTDKNYYYGVGMSNESMDKAKDKAREELIKGISITIEVKEEHTVFSESKGGKDEKIEQGYSGRSRIMAGLKDLPDLEIIDTDIERYNNRQRTEYYALVGLKRTVYNAYIKGQWGDVQKVVSNGDSRLGSRHIVTALREYVKALEMAGGLPSYAGNPVTKVDIENKITDIENDLEMTAISGNDQSGVYGDSLDMPLVVQVHYEGRPLENFPLVATYVRGIGQLESKAAGAIGASVQAVTDAMGQAVFQVAYIQSISRKNHIRVAIDQVPNLKDVVFSYSSSFSTRDMTHAPVIRLNGSADEHQAFAEGDVVKIEILVRQTCYLHLFEILADGHFAHKESVPIEHEHRGEGWRILRRESKWALVIDRSDVTAERGVGLETLLVVATKNQWQPVGDKLTPEGLIRQLNEDVGVEKWQAGSASYFVQKAQ